MQPAVFLDRDNTLIVNDGDLGDPNLVRVVDGVSQGLKALREAGYRLVVVTNQAGVARGKFTEEDVDAVHQRIAMMIDEQAGGRGLIDRFYYCPYHPEASVQEYRRDHPWRKPHPGMILQAARDMGVDLSRSWMLGDQERDILAGKAAGCRTVLVSRDVQLAQKLKPTDVAATFPDAAKVILQHRLETTRSAMVQVAAMPPTTAGSGVRPAGLGSPFASSPAELAAVRQAVHELTEEFRGERLRKSEFRLVTMIAGLCQLLALLLALLGLLQLGNFDVFMRWMIGATLVQMVTATLLILDLKG